MKESRQNVTRSGCALIAALLASIFAGCARESQSVDSAAGVEREIVRLEATVASIDRSALPESLRPALDRLGERLQTTREIDSPLLKLYRLRDVFVAVETLDFLASHAGAADSIETLEAVWTKEKSSFDAPVAKGDGSLRAAMIEVADIRARRLFMASLQYGRISDPGSGLYYLSEAEGNLRFREFVEGLEAGSEEPRPVRAAVVEAADRIESSARAAIEDDPTSREMIPVSVRLDEARELIESERLAGAALMLLEARMELLRRTTESAPDRAAPSADRGGTMRGLLRAWGERESEGEVARLASSDLMLLYDSMTSAATDERTASAAEVTLTLVRWPYT